MKIVPGTRCCVPDEEKTDWLTALPVSHGFPVYQRDRLEAAISGCRQMRTAIDGGAHIGLWTHPLSQEFRSVIAFEPVEELADCLVMNTSIMPCGSRVTIRRKALAEVHGGIGEMIGSPRKSVAWHIPLLAEVVPDKLEKRAVSFASIDHYALDDVDLIKLDVEGFEYAALLGAVATIKRTWPVIVIEEKHDPANRATVWLQALGYKVVKKMKHDLILVK
jgi:FkbM family methyltransferase